MWHKQLGHRNPEVLKNMEKQATAEFFQCVDVQSLKCMNAVLQPK